MRKSIKRVSSKTMTNGVAAVGLDLSDRTGQFHAIDDEGKTIETGKVTLGAVELQRWAGAIAPTVIAIEAGTHSPWISRLLTA
jgi:transposase